MGRPITLCTAQWADIPFKDLAKKCAEMGFDGMELATWGDHFEVEKALDGDKYLKEKKAILEKNGLKCWAIACHLAGQLVCDSPLDERHKRIISPEIWGDGDPEGIHQRAAEWMKKAAAAAKAFGVEIITGFTGSSIWHKFFAFPPITADEVAAGYKDFAKRWTPIMDAFKKEGVKFGLEVHPSEIAYDFYSTGDALKAINHPNFGINFDPSHLPHQFVDPAMFIMEYGDKIFHVHMKDSKRRLDGKSGILCSHYNFGDPRRGWDFITVGRGDVKWDEVVRALNNVGYKGPLSVEWEDCGMERFQGAAEALRVVKANNFVPSTAAFDEAFSKK